MLDIDQLAVEVDFAAYLRIRAKNQPSQLSPAGSDQPGQTQDLASPDFKACVLDELLVGHVSHSEDDVTGRVGFLWIEIFQLSPDHHLDDAFRGEFRARQLANVFAIPEIRKGDPPFIDLGHSMADVDDRHAF